MSHNLTAKQAEALGLADVDDDYEPAPHVEDCPGDEVPVRVKKRTVTAYCTGCAWERRPPAGSFGDLKAALAP